MAKHCLKCLTFLHPQPHPTPLPPPPQKTKNFSTILIFELWLVYEVSLEKSKTKIVFIMFISLQYYFRDKFTLDRKIEIIINDKTHTRNNILLNITWLYEFFPGCHKDYSFRG